MQAQHNTTLDDSQGNEVQYMTVAFPTSEGTDLLLTIGQIVGGPVGYMIQSFFSMAESGEDMEVDFDLSQLPEIVERIPRLLVEKGGSKLIQKILAKTKRCNGEGNWQALKEQRHFDSIYASNYLEMFKALLWVLEVNFAPFSTDGTPSWKGLWSRLNSIIPITPTENLTPKSVRESLRTAASGSK